MNAIAHIVFFLVIVLFLVGCKKDENYGQRRRDILVECMDLAAKMPGQQGDPVGDIVSKCSSVSMHLANSY